MALSKYNQKYLEKFYGESELVEIPVRFFYSMEKFLLNKTNLDLVKVKKLD